MMRFLIFLLMALLFFNSCDSKKIAKENEQLKKQVTELKTMVSRMRDSDDKLMFLASKMKNIHARIVTNYGSIEVKFFPEEAPLHCFNFIARAESGFYDHTQFHRVIKGFMIQGGDPNTRGADKATYGQGGPIVNIPNEFNDIHHKRGILSMARTSDPNAGAGSQFFIVHQEAPHLDHQYTAFGEVIKGMDVVDEIASVKTGSNDLPVSPVVIQTIEVFKIK